MRARLDPIAMQNHGPAPSTPRVSPAVVFALILGLLVGSTLANRVEIDSVQSLDRESGAGTTEPESGGVDPLPEEIEQQLAQLRAIGYVGTAESSFDQTGVVHIEADRVSPGFNLYNPAHAAEAYLIDSKGQVLHRWALAIEEAFPEGPTPNRYNRYWRRIRLMQDGGLLAIYEGVGLIRIDRDSRLVWARSNGAHHDLDVTPDGRLAVIRREAHINPSIHPAQPVLEDFIEFLDVETGKSIETFSIYDAFAESSYASALTTRKPSGDIFHTNTLQVLDGSHADKLLAFRRGNLLVSLRELSLIAVIDPEIRKVVWSLAGQWTSQHEPHLLDNGNILLFDNRGHGRFSKVIEFDPRTQETRWAFYGTRGNDFFSKTMGAQQRLPNGNTLITESNAGRVREVTAEGSEIWRFHSPHLDSADGDSAPGGAARICEMRRIPDGDRRLTWLR